MRQKSWLWLALALALSATGCRRATGYCLDDHDCPSGTRCSAVTDRCEPLSPSTCFSSGANLPMSAGVVALALGRFTGSVRNDALVLLEPGRDALLPGTGSLQAPFGAPQALAGAPSNDRALSVVTGDWDGDGLPDVAVGRTSGAIESYLSQGAGLKLGWTAAPPVPGPAALATFDSNRDGKLDLVVASQGTGTGALVVMLGDGRGGFATSIMPALTQPIAVLGADLNRDNLADLVAIGGAPAAVQVFLKRLDGTFAPAVAVPAGAGPRALASADWSGDGVPDLAIANTDAGTISILLGQGDGSFTAAGPDLGPLSGPATLLAADVNGDGRPDLLAAETGGAAVQLFLGRAPGAGAADAGAAGPAGLTLAGTFATEKSPGSMALGDLDGDGHPDLLVAYRGSATVSLLRNTCP